MENEETKQTVPLIPTPALAEQARVFALEGARLWEEKLSLVVKACPRWCPHFVYAAAVRLVIKQEKDRHVFHENWTRRRRFKLFRPVAGKTFPPGLNVIFPWRKGPTSGD